MNCHVEPLEFVFESKSKLLEIGTVALHIGNCLDILDQNIKAGIQYDAIVTDPPYEIALHNKGWDSTGIAFSGALWSRLHSVLKPGGYVVAFGASRFYHHLAIAAETAGFTILPMLQWEFPSGLPKPVNISELFDRDNIEDRQPLGYRKGSGFTVANGRQGAQQRLTTDFPVYARGVSQESKAWLGFYYGNNAFKPAFEPILLAQKPPSEKRMIDNIRKHGVGALNLGGLKEHRASEEWPTPIFRHAKAKKADHASSHPSVKPLSLMEELCILACPPGGHILDPFAGTGTTGLAASLRGFQSTLLEQNPDMEEVIKRRMA